MNDVIDYEIYGFTRWDSTTWYPQENDYSGGGSKVYELKTASATSPTPR